MIDEAQTQPALVVTDNPVTAHSRGLPLSCPGVLVAVAFDDPPLRPGLHAWIVFAADGLLSLPTEVPLEPGPPRAAPLPHPVSRVILAPDASPAFAHAIRRQATCDPVASEPDVWPVGCVPRLHVGGNVLILRGPK